MSQTSKRAALPRDIDVVLRELERHASAEFRKRLSTRFGIVTSAPVLGTPMASIKSTAKALGRDHAFAEKLWGTGVYEARLLASMVAEPERLTAAQMDRWVKECDNWSLVDTLCFNLFDRNGHAAAKAKKWARAKGEFVKRAGFALMACLALHRRATDEALREFLPFIEGAATDERNFVKKAVSWALRAIVSKGPRGSSTAARELAGQLAESDDRTARWIARDALKSSPSLRAARSSVKRSPKAS